MEEKENIEVNEIKKINFFKKIWWSITKVSKYEEMAKEGLGTAIKYFLILIFLLSIILAAVATYIQSTIIDDAMKYLDEILPELTFANNELNVETEEVIILDDEKFTTYFGYTVVINPYLERQQAIDEYYKLATGNRNCVVFLSNEVVNISVNYKETQTEIPEGVEVYSYTDHASKYLTDTSKEYKKQDIINVLSESISYEYYFGGYLISYIIMLLVFYLLYIITIALSIFIVAKLLKINEKLKLIFIKTIYAITLSAILYVLYALISYFTKITIPYFDVIDIAVAYIYLGIIMAKQKKM